MKVETAGTKGAKFAVRVRRFGRGQWPSCGRVDRLRPTACGRLSVAVCGECQVQSILRAPSSAE
jgi:hypothetical protein